MNGLIYKEQSEALTEAISKGYKSGLLKVVKKNTGTILKLSEPGNGTAPFGRSAKLFNISYTDVDKKLIDNFTVEAFTVAAVNQYDCEEKLKAIAKSIIEGSHPYMQKNPESDVKDLWRDEAYNILADYIEVPDMPPPGVLQTNLRTAVTSSYHAAQWQRLQGLKDIYPAYRYMTREDDLVRESHRALHGKVFNANDPIWNVITPPNGFNCRCYLEPLTDDELSEVEPENRIDIADEPLRKSLLKEASIDKNFARNSGKAESIWGKWLQEKLRSKNYDEVTERMKAVVNKMPEPEDVIKQLEKNAEPFRMLEFTKENWEKEFPQNKVLTPLGEFRLGEAMYDKLTKRTTTRDKSLPRSSDFGLVKPTIEKPEYIIVHKDNNGEYGTIFIKSFKDDSGEIIYSTVLKDKAGEVVFVSLTDRKESNISNKIKAGKLLLYSRRLHSAGSGSFGEKFPALPGLRFNFAESNLLKNNDSFNEVWGKFVSPGNVISTKIKYAVDGFEIWESFSPNDSAGNRSEKRMHPYSEIDNFRKGVLMWYGNE